MLTERPEIEVSDREVEMKGKGPTNRPMFSGAK